MSLTLAEVAEQLKCSPEHARKLCLAGELPYENIGIGERHQYRIDPGDLAEFKRQRKSGRRHATKPRRTALPKMRNLCGM